MYQEKMMSLTLLEMKLDLWKNKLLRALEARDKIKYDIAFKKVHQLTAQIVTLKEETSVPNLVNSIKTLEENCKSV